MTPEIRPLTRADDAAIWALMQASADYVWMEREEEPRPYLVDEFFTDAPPGRDPASGIRLGLWQGGELLALAELSPGYPTAEDAYLGLMIVRSAARGQGIGRLLLRALEDAARARGAVRLFLAVFDANPRARAFWQREGFAATGFAGSVTLGAKTQGVIRMAKDLSARDDVANPRPAGI